MQSLQEIYAPHSRCFGCGPANPLGLGLRSLVEGDLVVAEWRSQDHHQAFPGMLNGGIIGALLDCHSNWTAAWALMKQQGADKPGCTVTAEYSVRLRRPTPLQQPVILRARVLQMEVDRALVEAELCSEGKVCASCRGTFVQVGPGHPAYHAW